MYILMVTWFVWNQPPATSQTSFSSAKACEAARTAVLADQRKLEAAQESIPRMSKLPDGQTVISNPAPAPTVSTVCAAQ
jgi:hypothetical protein